MCGIAGLIDTGDRHSAEERTQIVRNMTNALFHRGPDGEGLWQDNAAGLTLGHRRLSIIDLSPLGAQPMTSASERYTVSYNGEIYNFRSLREALEEKGCVFKGQSDTEVMLAGFETWGVQETLERMNGMFALALWDRQDRVLYLARDRIGKKPLYYTRIGQTFLFASELKALHAYPDFKPQINRQALSLYLQNSYIPAPHSVYEGVYKLPPASFLSLPCDAGPLPDDLPEPEIFWDLQQVAEKGQSTKTENHSPEELETLLKDAVTMRMESDVPLGAFLSGGIDSSLIVALMQKQASRPVKTYSIGFEDARLDESGHARKIAEHLGTDHTAFFVTANEARAVIPKLPEIYDEPFADPSQIPTFHVCRLAKEYVTVALSGDGGDEVFGGYPRYTMGAHFQRFCLPVSHPARQILGLGLQNIAFNRKSELLSLALQAQNAQDLYQVMTSVWQKTEFPLINTDDPARPLTKTPLSLSGFIPQMQYQDQSTYLPGDILTKVDRASMAVSLEARAPLLDYRILEYAWQIPVKAYHNGQEGKLPLRQLLARHIPENLFKRPKQGFSVPLASWLRHPLREWAEDLLSEKRLQEEGLFSAPLIRKKWEEHLSGRKDWNTHLWSILMFQTWKDRKF